MERWRDRVAVVTGASSGIGAAITLDLVSKAGLIVVGLARRVERVEALRNGLSTEQRLRLHALKCDVSDAGSVNAAFDWIVKQFGGVDVLVNNAGTLPTGQLLMLPLEKLEQTIQTNVMGVVYCTRRAYQSMLERQFAGHVLIINSIVGHLVFNPPAGLEQNLNIYPSSKHAITAMVEILRQEFRGFKTKIKITSVSPGVVDTDILPPTLSALPMLKPEDISEGVLYALGTAPHVQVHELTIKPVGELF